jgi:hypothetical protein
MAVRTPAEPGPARSSREPAVRHDVRAQIVEVLVHRRGRRILVALGHRGNDGDVMDNRLAPYLGRRVNELKRLGKTMKGSNKRGEHAVHRPVRQDGMKPLVVI